MKTRYRSRLTGEFFKTEEAIIEHLEKEGIEDHYEAYYGVISLSEEDIAELEAKFKKYCEENPDDPSCKEYYGEKASDSEEDVEPYDSISEDELKNRARAEVSVDEFLEGNLDDTETKMLLNRLLGLSGDKSVDKRIHDKLFQSKSKTKTAIQDHYQDLVMRYGDSRLTACPICHKLWSNIGADLSLEGSDPKVREKHMKTAHIDLWNSLKNLFGMGADEIPDDRTSTVPDPESCSELESLSKEQLADRINESEELRHLFFREWLKKLKKRE